jgi:hypothetical protein
MTSARRPRTRARVRLALGLAAGTLAIAGVACGSDDGEQGDDAATEEERDDLGGLIAPAEDADFTFGNELVLTPDGPSEPMLVANVQLDIVVRNETEAPQTLRFTNGALDDGRVEVGPIPPGGRESWRATTTVTRKWELVGDPAYNGTLATDPGTFGDPDVPDTEG